MERRHIKEREGGGGRGMKGRRGKGEVVGRSAARATRHAHTGDAVTRSHFSERSGRGWTRLDRDLRKRRPWLDAIRGVDLLLLQLVSVSISSR